MIAAALLLLAQGLVERLGSDSIEEREEAAAQLKARGLDALDELEAAARNRDAEIAARARVLLEALPPEKRYQRRLASIDPGNPKAREALAGYCLSIGHYAGALEEYREAARLDPALRESCEEKRQQIRNRVLVAAQKEREEGRFGKAKTLLGVLSDADVDARKLLASIDQDEDYSRIFINGRRFLMITDSEITFQGEVTITNVNGTVLRINGTLIEENKPPEKKDERQ